VLTRRGKPVAELRPVESKGPRKFGAARDLINDVAPDFNAPLDDFKDYQ
jgi:antitoxin (DNA-binding transcriptional repressor) of toxin-antitoxin stability system